MSDATSQETRNAAAAAVPPWAVGRIWQIPEADCDCKRDEHKAREPHPDTMIGRK